MINGIFHKKSIFLVIGVIIIVLMMGGLFSFSSGKTVKVNQSSYYVDLTTQDLKYGLTVDSNGILKLNGNTIHLMGVNLFSTFIHEVETGDGAYKSDLDLVKSYGIPFVRIPFCSWGPEFYEKFGNASTKNAYLSTMDKIVDYAEEKEIGLVIDFFWLDSSVFYYNGEQRADMGNVNSRSIAFAKEYVTTIINRYKYSPAIWGYEIGNEYALSVDLYPSASVDVAPSFSINGTNYNSKDFFTTNELVVFYKEVSDTIYALDSYRFITNGDAALRSGAASLYTRTENVFYSNHTSWINDFDFTGSGDYKYMIAKYSSGRINTASLHLYDYDLDKSNIGGFDSYLNRYIEYAQANNKALFLGEFSGNAVGVDESTSSNYPFSQSVFDEEYNSIKNHTDLQLSAVWMFSRDGNGDFIIKDTQEKDAYRLGKIREYNSSSQSLISSTWSNWKSNMPSITVKYVDSNGNPITTDTVTRKRYGSSYTTSHKSITGYNYVGLKDGSDAASGAVDKSNITVTYVYENDAVEEANIVVKYVDESGNEISSGSSFTKNIGDSYTTVKKDITNYEYVGLKNGSDAASGTVLKSSITVTYVYKKKSSTVVAKYVDDSNHAISSDVSVSNNYGDSYTTVKKDIANYEYVGLKNGSDAASGTVSKDNITVIYVYKKISITVTVKYIDYDTGLSIVADSQFDVGAGDNYTTTGSNSIPSNYQYLSKTDNFEGNAGTSDIEVIYYYRKKEINIESSLNVRGSESIHAVNESVSYDLSYQANLSDYVNSSSADMVVNLPYKIDTSLSDINGAVYDDVNKTLTWHVGINHTESSEVTIDKKVKIVYTGVKSTDKKIVISVNVSVFLGNKNYNDLSREVSTLIQIPSKVIVHYLEKDSHAKVTDDVELTGYVLGKVISSSKEVDGYVLIESPEVEEYVLSDDVKEVVYLYEKKSFQVRVNTNLDGSNVEGVGTYLYGSDTPNIVIVPKSGYQVKAIRINDNVIDFGTNDDGSVTLSAFSKINEDKNIEVEFVSLDEVISNPKTGTNLLIGFIFLFSVCSIVFTVWYTNSKSNHMV